MTRVSRCTTTSLELQSHTGKPVSSSTGFDRLNYLTSTAGRFLTDNVDEMPMALDA